MENNESIWFSMLQRINSDSSPTEPLDGYLKELCGFFGFGSGFIYQSDHTTRLFRKEIFSGYGDDHVPAQLDLPRVLGGRLYAQLAGTAVVLDSPAPEEDTAELFAALAAVFSAGSLILMPVGGTAGTVTALIGFADRREWGGLTRNDIHKAVALMGALAGRVRLRAYHSVAMNAQGAMGSVLDNLGIDVYVNDFYTHEVLYANRSMAEPYGGVENMVGKICWQVLYKDKTGPCDFCPQVRLLDENGEITKTYSWDYERPFDHSWFRVLSAPFRWVDGRLSHCVTSVDITENKQNEATIRRLAEMDTLTRLPNRHKMNTDCTVKLREAIEAGRGGYVIFFDLDKFKRINDEYGHRCGDALLAAVGDFLRHNEWMKGCSYRQSGDEFIVWCFDSAPEAIYGKVAALLDRFARPFELGEDGNVSCRCSVGVAAFPDDGEALETLIHKADMAMYAAKRAGDGQVYFYREGSPVPMDAHFDPPQKVQSI